MRNLILILCLIFFSCKKDYSKDEQLVFFVDQIEHELNARDVYFNQKFSISLSDDLVNRKGAFGISRKNEILIDTETFYDIYELYPERIEALVLHEIGHNRFGLDHTTKRDYNQRPVIMNPSTWQFINSDNKKHMYDQFVESL
jgi:predicted Zn-dependent protease